MGFLDKLLKRKADMQVSSGGGMGRSFEVSEDEESCYGDTDLIEKRIRKVLTENFGGYELRKDVDAASVGMSGSTWTYSYGIFKDGMVVGMVNILSNPNDYKKKIVLQSKQACADQRIGYVHFLSHLPNRYSYIENQIKKVLSV